MRGSEQETVSCSSTYSDKENKDENKISVPKLNKEPQLMKRRGKGGGLNLRKSLAWNRAFFTDEGVLDPLELSMITGNFDKPCLEQLSVIHETTSKSISADSGTTDGLSVLQEKLLKVKTGSTQNKGTSKAADLLPKRDLATQVGKKSNFAVSCPRGTRKVLSAHDANKSGSKRDGCSQALASLKRDTIHSTTKAAPRESKFSHVPVSKSDHCSFPTTSKNAAAGASSFKPNQDDHRVSGQRSTALTCPSKSTRSTQSNAKDIPDCKSFSCKSSIQDSRSHMNKLPLEVTPSSNHLTPLVNEIDSGHEVITHSVHAAAGTQASNKHNISRKVVHFLSQNDQSNGRNASNTRVPTKHPGLRMPSPSLGFFNQPNTSVKENLSKGRNESCSSFDSYIPNPYKSVSSELIRKVEPPFASRNMFSVANGVTANGNNKTSVPGADVSFPASYKYVREQIMKIELEVDSLEKLEAKVPSYPKLFQGTVTQQQMHSRVENARKNKEEHGFSNVGLRLNPCDQKMITDVTAKRTNSIGNTARNDVLVDDIISFEESQEGYIGNIADASVAVQHSTGSARGSFSGPSEMAKLEQVSSFEDITIGIIDARNASGTESCDYTPSYREVHKQCKLVNDDVNEQSRDPCLVGEQVTQDSCGKVTADPILLAQSICAENSGREHDAEYDAYDVPKQGSASGGSKASNSLTQLSALVENHDMGAKNLPGQLIMSEESGPLDVNPAAGKYESFGDNDTGHEIRLTDQDPIGFNSPLDTSKYQIKDAVTELRARNPFCHLSEVSESLAQLIQQSIELNEMKENNLPDVSERRVIQRSNSPRVGDNFSLLSEDNAATLSPKKPGSDEKNNELFTRPPPNVAPFSDEWLAAIETAGEDILTLKTGAVQHSPPEKSAPEPNLWSPVKRKNNQTIGPFDCTKYTNVPPSSSP